LRAVFLGRRCLPPANLSSASACSTPDAAAADGRATKDKPKVDLELLKQPDGLPFLYHNFQPLFAKQAS
jgi:hypothetical protein